jgi:transcriptional regulator with XRE-family HTH domain
MEQLGNVIRRLRLASAMSQGELAARAGISASLLSLIEKNRREPTLRGLRRIATSLGVPSGVLFAVALSNATDPADPRAQEVIERLVEVARKQLLEQQLLPTAYAAPSLQRTPVRSVKRDPPGRTDPLSVAPRGSAKRSGSTRRTEGKAKARREE